MQILPSSRSIAVPDAAAARVLPPHSHFHLCTEGWQACHPPVQQTNKNHKPKLTIVTSMIFA